MPAQTNNGEKQLNKYIASILGVVLIGLVSFTAGSTISHGTAIAQIQENRFTNEDGAILRGEMIEADDILHDEFVESVQELKICIIKMQNGQQCEP